MSSREAADIKHINELQVFRGNHKAGSLKRTESGCQFHFDEAFLKNQNFDELTYRLKKQTNSLTYHGVNLPPFFAGLLPEGLRLKALVQNLKTSEDDLFSLLAASGERVIGDIYVCSQHRPHQTSDTINAKEIDFYQLFEDSLKYGALTKTEDSFAGVQEKLSASMISFPVSFAKKNKSYILKLNPADKPNLIHNELQCLRLADKCGLTVNPATIVQDKKKNPGLLIESFDRKATDDGSFQMVHQEDACQFLNRFPADKYRLSFAEICTGIQELATAPLIELLKAIQLYAFSYLIGNGDLHAKNISLQTDPNLGRVQITPAYDLICTFLYKDESMALKMDGRDKQFKRKNFLHFGQRYDLQEKAIHTMLDRLLTQFEKNSHLLCDIPNLTKKEKSKISNMAKTRIQHLR